jgi:hypothetical protein
MEKTITLLVFRRPFLINWTGRLSDIFLSDNREQFLAVKLIPHFQYKFISSQKYLSYKVNLKKKSYNKLESR